VNGLHALTDGVYAISMTSLVLEAIGLAQYAHWVYVRRNPHLAQPMDARGVRAATRRILTAPVAFAAAMLIALVSPRLGYAVYFVVLIAYITIAVRDRTIIH
jgi:uncharacterized membrane protein